MKSKKQSVKFDLPLSYSDRGKSTVDGLTLVVVYIFTYEYTRADVHIYIYIRIYLHMYMHAHVYTCAASAPPTDNRGGASRGHSGDSGRAAA